MPRLFHSYIRRRSGGGVQFVAPRTATAKAGDKLSWVTKAPKAPKLPRAAKR